MLIFKKHTKLLIPIMWLVLAPLLMGVGYGGSKSLEEKVSAAISKRYLPEKFEVTHDSFGMITLEGEVGSLYDKYRIADIASKINGVKVITNKIYVDTKTLPEEFIEKKIKSDIKRNNVIIEPDKIFVNVKDRNVILTGTVSYYRERVMAQTIASSREGVTSLTNNISVLPPSTVMVDGNLEDVLESTLEDEFLTVDPDNVQITVKDGFVRISGTVKNLWIKNNIEEEFSSVFGIVDVVNKLEVDSEIGS